jgi:hypothetical protein
VIQSLIVSNRNDWKYKRTRVQVIDLQANCKYNHVIAIVFIKRLYCLFVCWLLAVAFA